MSIVFGRARHIEKVKLQDCLTHPIWVSAHDDRHDEEMQKPITSTADVSDDVLRVDHPIITFKVDGRQWHGTGCYDHESGYLYAMALWIDGEWVAMESVTGLETPIQLIAVPTIMGQQEVRFTLKSVNEDRAYRAA